MKSNFNQDDKTNPNDSENFQNNTKITKTKIQENNDSIQALKDNYVTNYNEKILINKGKCFIKN